MSSFGERGFPPSAWVLGKKEEARIRHRQRLLQERNTRIHLPRATSIAVDVAALNRQVTERESKARREREEERESGEIASKHERLALLREIETKQVRDAARKNLEVYWKEVQSQELKDSDVSARGMNSGRPDYDISFLGEDLQKKEREKAQKLQTQQILREQIQELRQRRNVQKERESMEGSVHSSMVQRAQRIEEAEQLCRKAHKEALKRANEDLAAIRRLEMEAAAEEERKAIKNHILHSVESTLLTEDPRVCRSLLGPHRVLCDRWKGMSDREKETYDRDLKSQIEQNKLRRATEQEAEERIGHQCRQIMQSSLRRASEEGVRKREETARILEENRRLAEQQRKTRANYEMERNTNFVTEDFFDKFGIYPR